MCCRALTGPTPVWALPMHVVLVMHASSEVAGWLTPYAAVQAWGQRVVNSIDDWYTAVSFFFSACSALYGGRELVNSTWPMVPSSSCQPPPPSQTLLTTTTTTTTGNVLYAVLRLCLQRHLTKCASPCSQVILMPSSPSVLRSRFHIKQYWIFRSNQSNTQTDLSFWKLLKDACEGFIFIAHQLFEPAFVTLWGTDS